MPLLHRSMSSTSNAGLSYPSSRRNFTGRDGFEDMMDNGAHRYTATPGLAESTPVELQDCQLVLQRVKELMAVGANIDSELRDLRDLYHKLQYARAQQSAHLPFTAMRSMPIPYVPFTANAPYPTANSFSQTNLSASQGETWNPNIPNHIPLPSTSQLSTALDEQPPTPPLPKYPVRNCVGKKVFRCECGHEASRMGDLKRHRQSLAHAKKNHICHCGRSYTRKDSLLRHATIHMLGHR